ncbi:hypothetical protein Bbelb_235670 [Branchiostoma belcheri]|nr:hypothetical protein Bbelb_235670 [Branchiostoma belcheri]
MCVFLSEAPAGVSGGVSGRYPAPVTACYRRKAACRPAARCFLCPVFTGACCGQVFHGSKEKQTRLWIEKICLEIIQQTLSAGIAGTASACFRLGGTPELGPVESKQTPLPVSRLNPHSFIPDFQLFLLHSLVPNVDTLLGN